MKHIKLFEDFDQDSNLPDLDFYDLTNGEKVFLWEEPFKDMGGETNFTVRYKIGKGLDNAKDATYKEVVSLLNPEDKKDLEEYLKRLGNDNAQRSEDWVR